MFSSSLLVQDYEFRVVQQLSRRFGNLSLGYSDDSAPKREREGARALEAGEPMAPPTRPFKRLKCLS